MSNEGCVDSAAAVAGTCPRVGVYESEVSEEGEGFLHTFYTNCTKNPGHKNFIPRSEFSRCKLPQEFQADEDLEELVKLLADLTVRVDVNYKSDKRPNLLLFYVDGPRHALRTGTGRILVVKFPTWYNGKPCPCFQCKNSENPKTEYAELIIYTAAHMVYDDLEGQHTTCLLYYDAGDNIKQCSDIKTMSGMTRVNSDSRGDRCQMVFVTHDLELADELRRKINRFRDLNAIVWNKYRARESQKQADSLTIIISHPHGCSKQISIGYSKTKKIIDARSDVTRYTYDTPTCPGSSGAPVYIVGMTGWGMCEHSHSGVSETSDTLNVSAFGLF